MGGQLPLLYLANDGLMQPRHNTGDLRRELRGLVGCEDARGGENNFDAHIKSLTFHVALSFTHEERQLLPPGHGPLGVGMAVSFPLHQVDMILRELEKRSGEKILESEGGLIVTLILLWEVSHVFSFLVGQAALTQNHTLSAEGKYVCRKTKLVSV